MRECSTSTTVMAKPTSTTRFVISKE